MASQIDPTLDGKLNVLGAGVPRDELKGALTTARDEISALQAADEEAGATGLEGRVSVVETVSGANATAIALKADKPTVASLGLASGAASITAGSTARITGTAAANVPFTISDGSEDGQLTRVTLVGDPDGNAVSFLDASDPANELVQDAAQGSWYLFEWRDSATTLIAAGTTTELGPFATLATLALSSSIVTFDPTGLTYATSANPQTSIAALDAAVAAAVAPPSPSVTTSNASPFLVTAAMIASQNATITTHQASVDFDINKTLPAGTWINFLPAHAGATVSVQDDAGSISGTTSLYDGAPASAYISANPGSAPVVQVFGGIDADTSVNSTRTYARADHRRVFTLIASAGNQTMPAAANVPAGWCVEIINRSGGAVNIVGADATEALADDGALVVKKAGGSLVAIGNGNATVVELDAA